MAEYTLKPIPVYEARQINTPEDATAWIESLTEDELIYGGNSITNVRIEFVDNTMWLRYTMNGEGWSEDSNMDTDIGAYAVALKSEGNVNLFVMGAENFNNNFQPYPVQP